MPPHVKFSTAIPGADRIHYVNEEDIHIVLSRLPMNLWNRLRAVHFNDQSHGGKIFGYVNRGRRDIALCALPPRMTLTQLLVKGQIPEEFGARRGQKWPPLAIRRFILYDIFLHEIGHLQLVNERARSARLKYADEKLARRFARDWRKRLWSQPFPHPDPVHSRPTQEELALLLREGE